MGIKQFEHCRGKIKIGFFLFLLTLVLNSCQKTDINFGSQFVDNNYTQIIKIDTINTTLETRFYDSIQTNGTAKGLCGIYNDPLFGIVKASSYFKINPPQYHNDSDYSRTSYDSLVLIIRPDKHFHGDTTKPIHLDVFRLAATLQAPYNASYYYNFDTIQKYPSPLGSTDFTFYPHNHNSDSIVVRLSDGLGIQLHNLIKAKDASIQSSDNFLNFFKGICISSGNNPSAVFSFSDSVIMRLYYQQPGVITTRAYKDFVFNDANNQFNNISINRSGTPLGTVTPNLRSLVSSAATGNAAYLQAVSGTGVKVSFPYIRSVLQIPNIVKLAKAVLVLKPAQGTYGLNFPLPDSLRLSQTDVYNNNFGDISYSTGSTTTALIGSLITDYLYGQNTQYTFDITSYINTQLVISENNANGLVVSPPQPLFSTRFNRVVFDNSTNPLLNSQLLVYYITVQ